VSVCVFAKNIERKRMKNKDTRRRKLKKNTRVIYIEIVVDKFSHK